MRPSVQSLASLALLAVLSAPGPAQVQLATNRAWAATLGGAGNDWGQAMAAHADGGAFVAGRTSSFGAGSEDLWVTRLDRRGEALWETAVGSKGFEEALAVLATSEGGCLVGGGAFFSGATSTDAWLVQLDWTGGLLWQRSYAGPDEEHVRAIALAPDGGYYLGGTILDANGNYDAWVAKVGMWGDVEWQERFDGGGTDFLTSITATEEGVAFVANSTSALAGGGVPFGRPWLVSLDGAGGVLWQKTYDFSGGDSWSQIVALPGGGFIAVGEILFAAFFRGDVWAVRLDPDGDVLWDVRMGDHDGFPGYDGAVGVRPTANGGFAVLGASETAPGGLWMFQLDAAGSLVWNRSYGGSVFASATAFDVSPTGALFLTGVFFDASDSDTLAVRLAPNGRGPASCHLEQATNPNVWTSPLAVDAVALDPKPAALGAQEPTVSLASTANTTYLCPPGVPPSGGPSLSAKP